MGSESRKELLVGIMGKALVKRDALTPEPNRDFLDRRKGVLVQRKISQTKEASTSGVPVTTDNLPRS